MTATRIEPSPGFADVIATADELASLYGAPVDAVLSKVIDHVDGHCRDFIARAPFVLVSTSEQSGRCDVSPKGGEPGFVHVLDERRIAIPDAPGNKLIDSLRNIVSNPHVGLVFLVPGLEETLRVNGRAALTRDPAILAEFADDAKPPKIAIGVEVEEAYLHCAKAFKRSGLWEPERWPSQEGLARPAQIWRDHMALPDMTLEDVQEFVDDDYANNLTWR